MTFFSFFCFWFTHFLAFSEHSKVQTLQYNIQGSTESGHTPSSLISHHLLHLFCLRYLIFLPLYLHLYSTYCGVSRFLCVLKYNYLLRLYTNIPSVELHFLLAVTQDYIYFLSIDPENSSELPVLFHVKLCDLFFKRFDINSFKDF